MTTEMVPKESFDKMTAAAREALADYGRMIDEAEKQHIRFIAMCFVSALLAVVAIVGWSR